jgi:DNA-binding transcriptional MocR family regulator
VRSLEPRPQPRRASGDRAGAIDLSQNQLALDPALLDLAGLARELAHRLEATLLAGYQPAGQDEHRAAGAAWIARSGLVVEPERVVVTTGGQQALAAIFAAYARPGETVLVEELTYSGIKSLAALFHVRLHPVAIDGEGLVPEALEDACRRTNPKLLYCMPNLHNPTGVVLSAERRERVAELARKYGVFVVEDDASGFLLEDPPPPIAAFAPERAIFVASLSKSLAPGLRVGYLAAPEQCLGELHQSQSALTWMTPVLTAELASGWIRDGALARVVEKKRAELAKRRALFHQRLQGLTTESHADSPCLWAHLPEPWRPEEFAAAAERAGVLLSPAGMFAVSRTHAPHAVRLCLGAPSRRTEVETALSRLARVLEGTPAPTRALV